MIVTIIVMYCVFFLWFSYVLVCSLFTVVKNGLTVLKRWPAVVVQRDLSTQRFVLFWVLFSSAFFSQGGKISVVCSIFSPASCLWNLLGWVTFDFCDIHSFRQRSHVVPGHGVQVRYPLGTNVAPTLFSSIPTLEFGHGACAQVQALDLVLGHKRGHRVLVCSNFCKLRAVHCFVLATEFMFQNGVWQGEME